MSGLQTKALQLGTDDRSDRPLPVVTEPPPLSLTADEIEKDRSFFRARAEGRGEVNRVSANSGGQRNAGAEEVDEDDVNGFGNTAEGKKARKKVSLCDIIGALLQRALLRYLWDRVEEEKTARLPRSSWWTCRIAQHGRRL